MFKLLREKNNWRLWEFKDNSGKILFLDFRKNGRWVNKKRLVR